MSNEKPTYPSRLAEQFVVRFPDGMRDRLKEAAHANGRSMNAEIIARLQKTFDQPAGVLVGRLGDEPSVVDEIAAVVAGLPKEQLQEPLLKILGEMRSVQEGLTAAASEARETITLLRKQIPAGARVVIGDKNVWIRRMDPSSKQERKNAGPQQGRRISFRKKLKHPT